MTLREAYEEMNRLPDLKGIVSDSISYKGGGWLGGLFISIGGVCAEGVWSGSRGR